MRYDASIRAAATPARIEPNRRTTVRRVGRVPLGSAASHSLDRGPRPFASWNARIALVHSSRVQAVVAALHDHGRFLDREGVEVAVDAILALKPDASGSTERVSEIEARVLAIEAQLGPCSPFDAEPVTDRLDALAVSRDALAERVDALDALLSRGEPKRMSSHMAEPRRWTIAACPECDAQLEWWGVDHRAGCSRGADADEHVRVIEAAPVEAELERLWRIEAVAKELADRVDDWIGKPSS